MTSNQKAFLDMIAISEIGPELLKISDNGYNVIVGSTPQNPILFHDYSRHPHQLVKANGMPPSTAAGRYQTLAKYADYYIKELHLPDFGPDSQDAIALEMIKECRALPDLARGDFESAVLKCASRWASLPGAIYGQHVNKMEDLKLAYINAGGTIA